MKDRPDGQSIQSIGQVDGVGRPDDDEHGKEDVPCISEVRHYLLKEREDQSRIVIKEIEKDEAGSKTQGHLNGET